MRPEIIIEAASLGAFALAVFNLVLLKRGEWSRWERCGRLILPKSLDGRR